MNIYLDTEFIERPCTIDLISIGLVKETGETYYAISDSFNNNLANKWVMDNVISKLEPDLSRKSLLTIKDEIIEFIGNDEPQFWGYYCDYDWVVFCWLFGSMIQLPNRYPMYCRDLKQELDRLSLDKKWIEKWVGFPQEEHNALEDAKWNRKLHEEIERYVSSDMYHRWFSH